VGEQVANRSLVADRIKSWFDKTVREPLLAAGFDHYVIDFGIMEKKSSQTFGRGAPDETLDIESVCVIELNPWGSSTDR
jgi:hypothetical protein